MEEVPDDFEKELAPEPPCEPPPLVREKTVKRGRPKKEAKKEPEPLIKKEAEPPIIEVETPPNTPETPPEKRRSP